MQLLYIFLIVWLGICQVLVISIFLKKFFFLYLLVQKNLGIFVNLQIII